jgi:hypothetical protein
MYILISEPEYHLQDLGQFHQQEFDTLDEAILAAGEVEQDFRDWYIFQGQRFPDEEWLAVHKQVEKRASELREIKRAAQEEIQKNREIAEYRRLRGKYGDNV